MGFVLFLGVDPGSLSAEPDPQEAVARSEGAGGVLLVLNIPNYLKPDFTLLGLHSRGDELVISFEVLLPMGLLILLSIPLDRLRRYGYLLAGLTLAADRRREPHRLLQLQPAVSCCTVLSATSSL